MTMLYHGYKLTEFLARTIIGIYAYPSSEEEDFEEEDFDVYQGGVYEGEWKDGKKTRTRYIYLC